MREISIKIRNYKCFGTEPQGFDAILPINIIIGRNNTGKSSFLDLIHYAVDPSDLRPLRHKNQDPQVILKIPLTEHVLKRVFPSGTSGGEMRVRSLIVHSWFIINSTCKENLVFQPPVFPFSKGLRLVML